MALDTKPFFALVEALIANRQQSPEVIANGLGVTFGPAGPNSTALATVRESGPSAALPWVSALLRTPATDSQVPRMVGLVVDDSGACIAATAVHEHFGTTYQLDIPRPEQPASALLFHAYRKEWGTLKFGFSRQGGKCLKTVYIEFAK